MESTFRAWRTMDRGRRDNLWKLRLTQRDLETMSREQLRTLESGLWLIYRAMADLPVRGDTRLEEMSRLRLEDVMMQRHLAKVASVPIDDGWRGDG